MFQHTEMQTKTRQHYVSARTIKWKQKFPYGSTETNLTGIHEDTGSIPGLAWWVKDPLLR